MSPFTEVCKDPWGAPAHGVTDEFSSPTAALKLKSATSLTTNSSGNAAIGIQGTSLHSSHFNVATVTVDAITNWTATVAAHPDYTSLAATYIKYRPVSMGVKVYYTGAEQTTAGLISISAIEGSSLSFVPTTVSEMADLPNTTTIASAAMTKPLCGACHMFDRAKFMQWNSSEWVDFFPYFIVAVSGAQASSACVRIEVTINLELLPILTAFAAHHASAVVPSSASDMEQTRRLTVSRTGEMDEVIKPKPLAQKRKTAGSSSRRTAKRAKIAPARMASYRIAPAGAYKRRKSSKRKRKLYRRR